MESYKDTIIGHLVNTGTAYLLPPIVKCWCSCAVDKYKWYIPMVLYCSYIMYTYYSCLGFFPSKQNEEGKYIQNKIFNNIPHFIKNRFRVKCLKDGFVI